MLDQEKEREDVKIRTEQNRKDVPATVVRALEQHNITLDDILKMTRVEFRKISRTLHDEDKISKHDKTALINFKHDSMTRAESLVYFEPTTEEISTAEEHDSEFKRSNDISANKPLLL